MAPRYPAQQSPLSREEPWSSRATAEHETGRGRDRDRHRDAQTLRDPDGHPTAAPLAYFGGLPPLHASATATASASASASSAGLSPSSRREIGQQILRDSLRHASPGRRLRLRRDPTVRLEGPDSLAPPGRDWPHHPAAPSSPSGPAPEPPTRSRSANRVSFTPHFAPAHPVDGGGDDDDPTSTPRRENSRPSDDSNDRIDVDMPLLRRVGHRSVTDANDRGFPPHSLIDGLGDRERSFGPEDAMAGPPGAGGDHEDDDDDGDDDDEMHDTWETLLTTIQPDEQLPSAGSSFDSATATASSALSRGSGLTNSMNSAASSRTAPSSFSFAPSSSSRSLDALDAVLECPMPFGAFAFISSDEEFDTEPESDRELEQRGRNQSNSNSLDARRRRQRTTQPDTQESQQPPRPPPPASMDELRALESENRERYMRELEQQQDQQHQHRNQSPPLHAYQRQALAAEAANRQHHLAPWSGADNDNDNHPPPEPQQPQQPSLPQPPPHLHPNLLQYPDRPLREAQPSRASARAVTDNLPPELQQMHAILDRLARRDDIPDEWWETAGLSRTIRRELNNDDANNRSGDGGD